MRRSLLALTIGIAMLSVAAPARAEDHRIYGAELEGFDYPHDVYRYASDRRAAICPWPTWT